MTPPILQPFPAKWAGSMSCDPMKEETWELTLPCGISPWEAWGGGWRRAPGVGARMMLRADVWLREDFWSAWTELGSPRPLLGMREIWVRGSRGEELLSEGGQVPEKSKQVDLVWSSHLSRRFAPAPGEQLMKAVERKQESYSGTYLHMKASTESG